MTKFFFNVRHEGGVVRDEDGADLPNVSAAATEAARSAEAFVREASTPGEMVLEVANAMGHTVVNVDIQAIGEAAKVAIS